LFKNTVCKYAQYPQQNFLRLKHVEKCEKIRKEGQFWILLIFLFLKF